MAATKVAAFEIRLLHFYSQHKYGHEKDYLYYLTLNEHNPNMLYSSSIFLCVGYKGGWQKLL